MLIGELSTATGASTRSLRYYEERGLIQADRSNNGYRHYHEEAVEVVTRIRGLLELGLPTELIKAVLPCTSVATGTTDCSALDARVRETRDDMTSRIDRLVTTRDALDRRLRVAR